MPLRENLEVNNKDNRCLCLGTIGLIVPPWKFDVLKTSIFALQAYEHQISAGQLSADSSSTETLYCLNSFSTETLYCLNCAQWLSQSDYSIRILVE